MAAGKANADPSAAPGPLLAGVAFKGFDLLAEWARVEAAALDAA